MVELDKVIDALGGDDVDVDFSVGGRPVFHVAVKDRTIDLTIRDARAFKDIVKRYRK